MNLRSTLFALPFVLALAACQETPTESTPDAPAFKKSAQTDLVADVKAMMPEIAAAAMNSGNGATFIETSVFVGAFVPDFDEGDLCLVFQNTMGNGSFYRMNPDGTVTQKISDPEAFVLYSPNLLSAEPGDEILFYDGSGTLQVHATGVPEIFEPVPGIVFISLFPPFRGATSFSLTGQVQLDMDSPKERVHCVSKRLADGTQTVFRTGIN